MNPPLTSSPLAFQLILALIGASAVIGAALITAGFFKRSSHGFHRERRVCLHLNGVISPKAVRVMGPESFEKNFKTGKLLLPTHPREYKYEVYERDSGKWLGRITNPTGTDDEVIVIDMETASEYWEPA